MMLVMVGVSLSIIKKFQLQKDRFSVLNQQFAMSIMMAVAFAYTYVTVIIVNVNEIFIGNAIDVDADLAEVTSYIITMPLITASLIVILRSFGLFSNQIGVKSARNKDKVIEKVQQRRTTVLRSG